MDSSGIEAHQIRHPSQRQSKSAVREHVSNLRKFFRVRLGADPEVWHIVWEYYLPQESSESAGTVMEFWDRKLGVQIQSPFRRRPHLFSYLLFAEMGICMTQFPCSEAAVERALSHFKVILAKTKHDMLNDLLGMLLFLRTDERALEMTTLMAFGEALEGMACAEHVATIQDEDEENLGQPEP
jgi:hypothetical protein